MILEVLLATLISFPALTESSGKSVIKVKSTLTKEASKDPPVMKLKRKQVEENLSNLQSILLEARLEKAKPDGYEFTDIDKGSVYDYLGFRIGDILLQVNGQTVDSQMKAAQLFVELRNESRFHIKIRRGGKDQVLSYVVEK